MTSSSTGLHAGRPHARVLPSDARVSSRYARVLSIAGSDSGGGAGIQADLKTFSALGCYGMTAITAITAQNTCGVTGIHGVPPDMLKAQIDAVVQDIGVDAVKIGMLHSPDVVRVVADAIRTHQLPHVVLDPVMVATSGDRLIAQETVGVLVSELFPLAEVVTPNLDEAGWLLGRSLQDADALEAAAQDLRARRRCCSKAGTCPAIGWWMCCQYPVHRKRTSFSRRALPRTTGMAPGARCRPPLPPTWRWGCRCSRRWSKPAATSWAQLPPGPM